VTLRFDSLGERRDTEAAFATRSSMSIPLVFRPTLVDGRRTYDGGLRNNFPLAKFLADWPRTNFIAPYLGRSDSRAKRWIGWELLDIVLDGEKRNVVDKHRRDVVVINTSPSGTVDLRLSEAEKRFLLLVGQVSALRFLLDRGLDDGPSEHQIVAAEQACEASRLQIRRLRSRRRWIKVWVVVATLSTAAFLYHYRSGLLQLVGR
jgi:patatin-like phospholipase